MNTTDSAALATISGALIFPLTTMFLINEFHGQHQPNDSMFGIVYLILAPLVMLFGAFLGRLIHYWASGQRTSGEGPSHATMFTYGAFSIAPLVIGIGALFYSSAEYRGLAWAGALAFLVLVVAAAAVIGSFVTGRYVVVALLLCGVSVGVFFYANDAADAAQRQRIVERQTATLEETGALYLPASPGDFTIESMRVERFQTDRTATVTVENSEGMQITIRSSNSQYRTNCDELPEWAASCNDLTTPAGTEIKLVFPNRQNLGVLYSVDSVDGYFTVSAGQQTGRSRVMALIDDLQVATVDEWMAEHAQVYS